MNAYLRGIQYHLPTAVRTNEDLVALNPGWDAGAILAKTGIRQRHVSQTNETAADLAYFAAEKLLAEVSLDRKAIDCLLFCTQSPDYLVPSTGCLLQDRLGLSTTCAVLDYNLACSGFVYGLWLARALILSKSASNVLLLFGDTYSKYCDVHDLTTVTIFGDGAAASLITSSAEDALAEIGSMVTGADGRGAGHLLVPTGGARCPQQGALESLTGVVSSEMPVDRYLHMNGPEVFSFTLRTVRAEIQRLLDQTSRTWDAVDLFLMHQANRFMLESLRNTLKIPASKMPIDMEDCGNTVSASIPILMRRCMERRLLQAGQRCVVVGFGAGYSWGMTELAWIAPASPAKTQK
jgi:3-oxoacyl-[acyl-carrier-protein] synthase-3